MHVLPLARSSVYRLARELSDEVDTRVLGLIIEIPGFSVPKWVFPPDMRIEF